MVGSLNLPMQFKDLTVEEHKSLELVANLIKVDNEGESNSTVGSLDKEKISLLDEIVEDFELDQRRHIYFNQSRLNDQTKRVVRALFYTNLTEEMTGNNSQL